MNCETYKYIVYVQDSNKNCKHSGNYYYKQILHSFRSEDRTTDKGETLFLLDGNVQIKKEQNPSLIRL